LPLFKAEIYTPDGEKKLLRREAAGENDLLRELLAEGLVVVGLKEEKTGTWSFIRRKDGKAKQCSLEDQYLFCVTLCSYMRSGLSITDVLKLLQKQTRSKNMKPVFTELRESVEAGRSLALSMQTSGVFKESLVGMVESGEKSASLPDVLEKAGEIIQNELRLRRKLKASLTYPLLMMFVGLGVVVFLMSFVVPRLTELVVDSGADLPFVTKLLIFISHAVRLGFMPFIAVAAAAFFYCRARNKKLSLPIFQDIRDNVAFSMIFSQVGTLVKAGIPLVKALKLTEPLDPVKGRLQKVADHIRKGYRFSQGLELEGSFPEEIITVVRVGESGGSLPDGLIRVGNNCWDYAQAAMQKWATLAEPVIILAMGFLVGFIVISVLLPIFDLSTLAVR
jgi:type II secretory pathway component PulF